MQPNANTYTPNHWNASPPAPQTTAEVWNPYASRIQPATWTGQRWTTPEGQPLPDTAYWLQPSRQ